MKLHFTGSHTYPLGHYLGFMLMVVGGMGLFFYTQALGVSEHTWAPFGALLGPSIWKTFLSPVVQTDPLMWYLGLAFVPLITFFHYLWNVLDRTLESLGLTATFCSPLFMMLCVMNPAHLLVFSWALYVARVFLWLLQDASSHKDVGALIFALPLLGILYFDWGQLFWLAASLSLAATLSWSRIAAYTERHSPTIRCQARAVMALLLGGTEILYLYLYGPRLPNAPDQILFILSLSIPIMVSGYVLSRTPTHPIWIAYLFTISLQWVAPTFFIHAWLFSLYLSIFFTTGAALHTGFTLLGAYRASRPHVVERFTVDFYYAKVALEISWCLAVLFFYAQYTQQLGFTLWP